MPPGWVQVDEQIDGGEIQVDAPAAAATSHRHIDADREPGRGGDQLGDLEFKLGPAVAATPTAT